MKYYEVKIETTIFAEEMISAILLERGAQGVVFEDSDISGVSGDYIDSKLISDQIDAVVKAYFPCDDIGLLIADIKSAVNELRTFNLGLDLGRLEVSYSIVDEEDWANNWKQYYKPLRIGKNIVICPKWEKAELKSNDVLVELDPGMAFGTGQHESTSMCLELLEKNVKADMKVLDLGCGSGILGICAKKLGASVVCVDIDENAINIAKDNAEYNKTEITFFSGNAITDHDLQQKIGAGYDLIVINIIADVIIDFADYIKSILNKNGKIIASGIIDTKANDVIKKLSGLGFDITSRKDKNDWVCLEVTN